ncbi:MAG: tellurite resistance TerB family protein [Pseudoalteromonas sp.]
MLGFFKKKAGDAKAELKKVENRDLMEAIIGGSLLVAAADGSIDDEELVSLEKQVSSNDSLKHFGAEIGKTINNFEKQLESGFRIGKMKILREIADIKNNPADAEEVFVNMLTIAEADGEIDEKELAILKEVGQTLGIRLSEYGIE